MFLSRQHLCHLLLLAALIATGYARASSAESPSPCNVAAPEPITSVSVPGRPFGIAVSRDGCSVFVGIMGQGHRSSSGVALLRRSSRRIRLEKFFEVEGGATDIVLTHDEQLLIVAGGQDIAFINVPRMLAHKGDAVAGYLNDSSAAGSINVNVTRDDKFLFVSDERSASVRVIDLEKARSQKFSSSAVIGRIPVGIAPIALTFSPDEKLLYTTVETMPRNFGWKNECSSEGGGPEHSAGAVVMVDVEKAKTDPEHSALKWIPAGCSTVRLALSAAGDLLYVTARASDAVMVFDTAKMLRDPANALVGKVPTGKAPVGITLADGGKKILVANSNRFSGSLGGQETLTVIDAGKASEGQAAVLGTLPAGSFPRELVSSPDGKTVFLSNFNSGSIEVINVERMPLKLTEKE